MSIDAQVQLKMKTTESHAPLKKAETFTGQAVATLLKIKDILDTRTDQFVFSLKTLGRSAGQDINTIDAKLLEFGTLAAKFDSFDATITTLKTLLFIAEKMEGNFFNYKENKITSKSEYVLDGIKKVFSGKAVLSALKSKMVNQFTATQDRETAKATLFKQADELVSLGLATRKDVRAFCKEVIKTRDGFRDRSLLQVQTQFSAGLQENPIAAYEELTRAVAELSREGILAENEQQAVIGQIAKEIANASAPILIQRVQLEFARGGDNGIAFLDNIMKIPEFAEVLSKAASSEVPISSSRSKALTYIVAALVLGAVAYVAGQRFAPEQTAKLTSQVMTGVESAKGYLSGRLASFQAARQAISAQLIERVSQIKAPAVIEGASTLTSNANGQTVLNLKAVASEVFSTAKERVLGLVEKYAPVAREYGPVVREYTPYTIAGFGGLMVAYDQYAKYRATVPFYVKPIQGPTVKQTEAAQQLRQLLEQKDRLETERSKNQERLTKIEENLTRLEVRLNSTDDTLRTLLFQGKTTQFKEEFAKRAGRAADEVADAALALLMNKYRIEHDLANIKQQLDAVVEQIQAVKVDDLYTKDKSELEPRIKNAAAAAA